MLIDALKTKLRDYAPANALEYDNAVQEIMQHFILLSLSRAGFFNVAAFHGGTYLRIINGIDRFSEDLDFLLRQPDPAFRWQDYLNAICRDCEREGLSLDVQDKSRAGAAVQKAFIKNDSVGKILTLTDSGKRGMQRKIRIKLEIDTNPPEGSVFETAYITFPIIAPLTTQTLASSFALKLHALLCRPYAKGRDWFDLVWYVSRHTQVNYTLLASALRQAGPWAGKKVPIGRPWLIESLEAVISRLDWKVAQEDVRRFLPLSQQENLRSWTSVFFCQLIKKIPPADSK